MYILIFIINYNYRCNIWLQNCKLEDTARIEHKTLCSDHFNSSCYISNTNRLLKNAIPTIFPGGAEHLMPEVVETLDQPAESNFSINAIFIKKKKYILQYHHPHYD